MSDKPKSGEEIPAFRITEKRVDDSWKEEIRREREAAKRAAEGKAPPARGPAPEAPAAPAAPGGEPQKEPAAQGKPPEKPARTGTPQEQQQSKIFLTFLAGLAQQALMQLGELENPYTGQQDIDMQGARYTIELLATIQAKTKGNLSEEEDKSLGETIHDLKLRYVEIANELQRQVQAQMQQGGPGGPGGRQRPGPGGTIGKR